MVWLAATLIVICLGIPLVIGGLVLCLWAIQRAFNAVLDVLDSLPRLLHLKP